MSISELLTQFREQYPSFLTSIGDDEDIIMYALRFLISNADDLEAELDDDNGEECLV